MARDFLAPALSWLATFEAKFSRFRPDSIVSRINAAAGREWVHVDAQTDQLLDLAADLHRITDGILDPTMLPLLKVWDWKTTHVKLPETSAIHAALALTGFGKIVHKPGQVFLPQAGIGLDFGGFGKEYAVDQLVRIAREHGIQDALIDLGRDLYAIGGNGQHPFWHVGLEDARSPGACWGGLAVSDFGVASSGDGLRHFERNGVRYGHILDPRSGWPVANGVRAVSVIATRLGSLVLLFQRMPVVQFLFPEANVIGGAAIANTFSLAVTTVIGLGAYDSVAGPSQINEQAPLTVLGIDPAGTPPTATNAINVPATVSAPLTFSFNWDPLNDFSAVKSWRCTTGGVVGSLPAGLSPASNSNSATAVGGLITISGTPTVAPGIYPVKVSVYRNTSYLNSEAAQIFNICVLGFSTQPAASTSINSGQTTTLTCVAAGAPVATTWHNVSPTVTYQWFQGLSGDTSTPVATTNSSTPGFTTPTLSSSINYWVRVKSVLSTSTVYANSTTAAVTVTSPIGSTTATVTVDTTADSTVESDETAILTVTTGSGYSVGSPSAATGTLTNDDTPFSSWTSGLSAGQSGADQSPQGDGVTNLEKFAFNLNPLISDTRHLTVGGGGTAGLPGGVLSGAVLRLEFLRRKASTSPGITYTAQFGSDLAGWTDIPVGTPPGTSIDATWERVTVDDPTGGATRFGRVTVLQTP